MIFFKKIATAMGVGGQEKVTNGGFSTNTSGWSAQDCTLASVAGGQSGNCLQITRTGGSFQYAYQSFVVTPGKKYKLSFYVKNGTVAGKGFKAGLSLTDTDLYVSGNSSSSWVQYSKTVIPKTSIVTLYLVKDSSDAGTLLFDTVSLIPIYVVRARDFHFQLVPSSGFDRTVKIYGSLNDLDFFDLGLTFTNNHAAYNYPLSSIYPDVSGGTTGTTDIVVAGRDA